MPGEERDGSTWRIGTDADVVWITNATSTDRTITSAIPPVFDAYATVVLPESSEGRMHTTTLHLDTDLSGSCVQGASSSLTLHKEQQRCHVKNAHSGVNQAWPSA
jgi:hypothetical protein